jgi:hypothetical protein
MKMRIAASAFTNPFQPVLNALPIVFFVGAFGATALTEDSGATVNCSRSVANETRSVITRFIAVYCSTSVSRSVN